MQKENFLLCIICLLLLTGCFTTKNFDPSKKFSKEQLQQDYTLLRNILEKKFALEIADLYQISED